jgi:hypothetical protein
MVYKTATSKKKNKQNVITIFSVLWSHSSQIGIGIPWIGSTSELPGTVEKVRS